MTKLSTLAVSLTLLVTVAPSVSAQEAARVRASVNIGLQDGSGQLTTSVPLTAPGGTGSFDVDDGLATSTTFDASGSVRVWKRLGLGVGFTRAATEHLAHPYNASVPSPIPGRLNLETAGTIADVVHGEQSVYLLASWAATVTNRFDIVVSGGPVFFDIDQGIPQATANQNPSQAATLFLSTTETSESTTGFHVGMDFDYAFGGRAGLGALVRYTRGSVDIPTGTEPMTVGGL